MGGCRLSASHGERLGRRSRSIGPLEDRPGNSHTLSPASPRASAMTQSASADNGTRFGWRFFDRLPGTVHKGINRSSRAGQRRSRSLHQYVGRSPERARAPKLLRGASGSRRLVVASAHGKLASDPRPTTPSGFHRRIVLSRVQALWRSVPAGRQLDQSAPNPARRPIGRSTAPAESNDWVDASFFARPPYARPVWLQLGRASEARRAWLISPAFMAPRSGSTCRRSMRMSRRSV